jgi:hypothetical protein
MSEPKLRYQVGQRSHTKLDPTYEVIESCVNCAFCYICIDEITTRACILDGELPPLLDPEATFETYLSEFQTWLDGRQVASNGLCDQWDERE